MTHRCPCVFFHGARGDIDLAQGLGDGPSLANAFTQSRLRTREQLNAPFRKVPESC